MSAAPYFALQAGALAGLGPCGLSRLLLLRAVLERLPGKERRIHALAFASGLVTGYLACASLFVAVAAVIATSPTAYAVPAAICIVGGACAAWKAGQPDVHDCRSPRASGPAGTTFVAGAASTLVGAPCCGPLSAAFTGGALSALLPRDAHMLVAAYALGHACPVLVALFAGDRAAAVLRVVPQRVSQGITGGVLFGLGGYYAISS